MPRWRSSLQGGRPALSWSPEPARALRATRSPRSCCIGSRRPRAVGDERWTDARTSSAPRGFRRGEVMGAAAVVAGNASRCSQRARAAGVGDRHWRWLYVVAYAVQAQARGVQGATSLPLVVASPSAGAAAAEGASPLNQRVR